MSESREILLADADVLIDYLASDLRILRLVSENIGKVHVLKEVLSTVRGLSEREARRHRIYTIAAEAEALLDAGSRTGALSFEDWLCFITCRERAWSCVTNDRALLRECRRGGVRVYRGLGLMVVLVRDGALGERRAIQVAEIIHEANPHHINERVMEVFRRLLAVR